VPIVPTIKLGETEIDIFHRAGEQLLGREWHRQDVVDPKIDSVGNTPPWLPSYP
jgi:hypothetical protein